MGVYKMDHRNKVILGLGFVVLVLLMFIGATTYKDKQAEFYNQGIQDGALLQQRNVLQSIQATGFYTINAVGQDGQPVRLILAPVQPQQAQQ